MQQFRHSGEENKTGKEFTGVAEIKPLEGVTRRSEWPIAFQNKKTDRSIKWSREVRDESTKMAFFAEQVVKQWDPLSQESHKCLGLHRSWLRSWTGSWEKNPNPSEILWQIPPLAWKVTEILKVLEARRVSGGNTIMIVPSLIIVLQVLFWLLLSLLRLLGYINLSLTQGGFSVFLLRFVNKICTKHLANLKVQKILASQQWTQPGLLIPVSYSN